MFRLGVIGCGVWGPNHVRNFSHLLREKEITCVDINKNRLQHMKDTFTSIKTTTNYKDILKDPGIKAVCIATPSATHYKLAKENLEHGKDVLCEKPMCTTVDEARELIEISEKKNCILMVGHVFLFNPGIRKLKDYIKEGTLGKIQYAHSERTNMTVFKEDVDVVLDLASHDVSIFNYLLAASPLEVSARGHKCLKHKYAALAFITLLYPHDILVNIHVSWIDPKKVRTITVIGDRKMVLWDDLSMEGMIKLYDKHMEKNMPYYETFGEYHLLSKEGDIVIPKIEIGESLKTQDAHFIDCVENRKQPIANGKSGLEVVEVLDAAEKSMRQRGAPIKLIKK